MLIRPARAGDADDVAAVFIASSETLRFLPRLHTHAEHRAFIRDVVLAEQEVWSAEAEGRVVGFAALTADMLAHLYVHPEAQGRGAGSALFARATERRPDGFSLWVFQENTAARRFYERRGCRVVRLTDGAGNEERTPDALYAWRPAQRRERLDDQSSRRSSSGPGASASTFSSGVEGSTSST